MHKKYYFLIGVSHLSIISALFMSLIRVGEAGLDSTGDTLNSSIYVNLLEYIRMDLYRSTAVFMLILAVLEGVGVLNALIGVTKNKMSKLNVNLAFFLSFVSVAMGALQVYSGSQILFLISAISFVVSVISAIRLIQLDNNDSAESSEGEQVNR